MGDYRYIENYFDNIPEKDSEFTDKNGLLLSEREIEGKRIWMEQQRRGDVSANNLSS